MLKYVVCHNGSRDKYLLSEALNEVSLLQSLITDLYVPNSLRGIIKRRNNSSIDSSLVKSNYYLFLLNRLNLIDFRQLDKVLSLVALKNALVSNSNLFCYSYYGFHAFSEARRVNFTGKKYLFQLHPHPYSVKRQLDAVLSETTFKNSILLENEYLYGADYLDELDQESKFADKIFTASTYTKNTLIENGIEESKIIVCPYGINTSHNLHISKSFFEKKLKIIFVGQPCQRKGLELLFKALMRFPQEHFSLVVVGRGIIDYELIDHYSQVLNFEFRKDISEKEKGALLANSDVLVLPSYSEGFGHVLLEALTLGTPVITTNNTGASDIFDNSECGFILNKICEDDLVDALEKVLSDRVNLSRMSKNGIEKVSQFTYENFKKSIQENL